MPAQNKLELPLSADLVVVSDVHIRRPFDERFNLLIDLIATAKSSQLKVFALNGDIFDFFFGQGTYFSDMYQKLFDSLTDLAHSGCRVLFVEGNHEFSMSKTRCDGIEIYDSFGVTVDVGGAKIKLIHGDLMHFDWKYFAFRRLVRSRLAEIIASLVPQNLFDKFTLWFASTSRKKDQYRNLNHERILATAKASLQSSRADHLIFGHFHHPYDETVAPSSRILSVDSWDKPSYIIFKNGQFSRKYL